MQHLYIDSSALIALIFGEQKAKRIRAVLRGVAKIYSSMLLEAEVYATARRETVALEKIFGFIGGISLVFPDRSLLNEYQKIFQMGYVRGADAHHIACALYLAVNDQALPFLTLDTEQRSVAKAVGLKVINL